MLAHAIKPLAGIPMHVHKAQVYGAVGSSVLVSRDGWRSARVLVTLPAGRIQTLHFLSSGNLMVAASGNAAAPADKGWLYRVTPSGNYTRVLQMTRGRIMHWGITSDGSTVFVTEYADSGTGGSIYRSTDDGQTFTEVFFADPAIWTNVHMHAIAIDPATDILWGCAGDSPTSKIFHLDPPNYNTATVVSNADQPTAALAVGNYILFGQDNVGGNGVLRYDKTTQQLTKVLDLNGTDFNSPIETSIWQDERTGYVYVANMWDGATPLNLLRKIGVWCSLDPFTSWDLIHEINPKDTPIIGSLKIAGIVDNELLFATFPDAERQRGGVGVALAARPRRKQLIV